MAAATTIAAVAMAFEDEESKSIDLTFLGTIPKSPEEQKCENFNEQDTLNIENFKLAIECLKLYLFKNEIEPNEVDNPTAILMIERQVFLNRGND